MRTWLRSLWLDAPEVMVSKLTDSWIGGQAPFFEALVEEVDHFDLVGTGVAFPMSPEYASHMIPGT